MITRSATAGRRSAGASRRASPATRAAGAARISRRCSSRRLNEPVYVTTEGERRKITKREAIVTQLVNKSATADLRATKMLMDLLKEVEEKVGAPAPTEAAKLTPADREVVDQFIARLRRQIAAEAAEAAASLRSAPLTAPASLVGGDAAPVECSALLWHDFASFALRSFRELNPRTLFAMNWHIELIAAQLAAVCQGRIRRLIVNLPPRHLKSHLASIAFPAWCLGHQPSAQILCVSYAQDLADKLSRDCRRIVASDWYQGLFPTRLSPQRQAVARIRDDGAGLAGRHLGRRGADRPGCRHHHHRRSPEARGGLVASPAAGGQRMV